MMAVLTPAERHRRLADIITTQDELAAAFMRLDWMVRELARAEFCEPAELSRANGTIAFSKSPSTEV